MYRNAYLEVALVVTNFYIIHNIAMIIENVKCNNINVCDSKIYFLWSRV